MSTQAVVDMILGEGADTTDDLIDLANSVSSDPYAAAREMDMLLTSGERISMALLSMALADRRIPALSFTGSQTGIITNTAGSLVNGPVGIPFALCNVVGALVWGYGIRSFGLGKSLPGLIAVGAICGVAVQAMAAPIITFVFGGATGHSSDALVAAISAAGVGTLQASFIGGLPGSFADKLIATFVGLAILQALPSGLTAGVGLPKTDQNGVL